MKNKVGLGFTLAFLMFLPVMIALPIPSMAEGNFPVSILTSRTSGTAPLSVFFDATSTSAISDGSYVDSTCAWNFDTTDVDTNANYRTGSGFVAAHVFDQPGTYNVRLDIYNGAQHAWEYVTITVTPFSGTTYYVATNGSDTNNGTSAATPFQTVERALTGSHVQPNTRILFRNGDTFYISRQVTVTDKSGPIIIGGYSDSGNQSTAKPIIYYTNRDADWATIHFYGCNDIRIMDIAARATAESSENPRYPYGIGWGYDCTNMLKYRTEEYYNGGMAMSPTGKYNTVAECSFHDTSNSGYTSSSEGANTENAIIGNQVYNKNLVDQSNEEHCFRLQGGSGYYIAHNTFGPNARVNYDTLTIRGNSEKVVIYKNTIFDYATDIQPQNKNSAQEYQHHCIIDSNLFVGQANNIMAISLTSKDIVVRNNIFYNYQIGIGLRNDTVVGPSQRIKIYNNTMINPQPNSGFYNLVAIDNGCFDIDILNNVMMDNAGTNSINTSLFDLRNSSTLRGSSDYNILYGPGWNDSTGLFDGLALFDWRSLNENDQNTSITNPYFANIDVNAPYHPEFCSPSDNSPMVNNGGFTGAALDYHGNLRDSFRDIGAVEKISNTESTTPSEDQTPPLVTVSAPRNLRVVP